MTLSLPVGDLARAISHDPSDEWPTMIEVVAYWGRDGRKGRRRSLRISADEFFGRGSYGASLTGDRLILMVEQLRRMGPK